MAEMGEGATVSVPPSEDKESTPEEVKKEPKTLQISVFFDGTGNNRANIQQRLSETSTYHKMVHQSPAEPKRGQTQEQAGTDSASFENSFSNISLIEEQFKDTCDCDYYTSIYIEGVGTRDLEVVSRQYEEKMRNYQQDLRAYKESLKYPSLYTRLPPKRPTLEGDSNQGFATATGSTGIYKKMDSAMDKILDWYTKVVNEESLAQESHFISKIIVDVYGFSRGAATARAFIHHILKGQRTIVVKRQTRRGTRYSHRVVPTPRLRMAMEARESLEVAENAIEIGFVGIFDTVSSYNVALFSDVDSLHLDAVKEARKVYHLASAEEHRLCFSLTDITSAKNSGIGEEYFLPGVHSDIGGGYRPENEEIEDGHLLENSSWVMSILNFNQVKSFQDFADDLKKEGWYINSNEDFYDLDGCNYQIQVDTKTQYTTSYYMPQEYKIETSVTRYRTGIKNTYPRIPLNLMVEAAEKEGFSFKSRLKRENNITSDLQQVDAAIRNYIASVGSASKAEDWFMKDNQGIGYKFDIINLRNQYLHYSACIGIGHWPRFKSGKRYRERYTG